MARERILTRRELNRALLERQLLLERRSLTPVRAVERLGGLQAQSTTSPYLSLWTRVEPFERADLTRALTRRRLVKTLYDLPRAPLPDPETPAPVRLVPRFDNLVLSHADRSRMLGDVPPSRIVTKNGIVHATILVNGFVAGTWQLERGRVRLEPFARLGSDVRRALEEEVERLEAFVA